MAIAGLVITSNAEVNISEAMNNQESIVQVEASHDPNKIVAVLDVSADRLQKEIENIQKIEGIIAVDVAYINYEDDIEREGSIPCPVHISKLKPEV